MSLSRCIGDPQFLNKKVKKNARYDHVKSRLDTGCSLSKHLERLEELSKNYRYRKDEIFKRLGVSTLALLVLQVASVSDPSEVELGDSPFGADGVSLGSSVDLEIRSDLAGGSRQTSASSDRGHAGPVQSGARSSLLSVINGVSELSLDAEPPTAGDLVPAEQPYPDCPYLLLDVRDRDEYDRCHIISAHSFPIATLSRTLNPYTKQVLEYRNAKGKIIIVYDEDERIAVQAATSMCERGFDNLFVLCGGLKVLLQKFPSGLTTGSAPLSCLSASTKKKQRSAPPPQAAEKRWRFTSDELSRIQDQLEEVLVTKSSCSSIQKHGGSVCSSASSSLKGSVDRLSQGLQSRRPWK